MQVKRAAGTQLRFGCVGNDGESNAMRWSRYLVVALGLILAMSGNAWADRHGGGRHHGHGHEHVHFGLTIGPSWGAWYGLPRWSPPPLPYPLPVIERRSPVYVELPPVPPVSEFWYYCPAAQAYYPYVRQCAGGWLRVLPSSPLGAPGP